ncbi:MAG: DUF2325 domain-containing protein [Pseudomonadota bacterium]
MCRSETNPPPSERTGRIKLWKIEGGVHCAIIGTCLSHIDLVNLAPKVGLSIAPGQAPYEVHGYFVQHASTDTPIARALHKLLDQRYGGIVRKVVRLKTAEELQTFWDQEYEAGRIPAVFWAFMSCAHIPADVSFKAFGQVHMLSHLLGQSTHRKIEDAAQVEAVCEEREAQLTRLREKHGSALTERDQKIAELTREVSRLRHQNTAAFENLNDTKTPPKRGQSSASETAKQNRMSRALTTARSRARHAEQQLSSLVSKYADLEARWRKSRIEAAPTNCPGADACELSVPSSPPSTAQKLLYLGGRKGSMETLRDIAKKSAADFLHHDGGIEDAFHRIEKLVASCDAVFCPVDCISHRASLHAKKLCQKHCKAFIALRSSGGATFARALQDLKPAA